MNVELDDIVNLTATTLQLRHPLTGELLGATMELAGPEHEARKRARWVIQRRHRAELAATGNLAPPDPEQDQADELAVLTACTLGWQNLQVGGLLLEFSAGACAQLYGDPRRAWIREQVKEALDDQARFIGSSAAA